ncbi:MAG: T9SS type A sorting domain-containing protein, partial [Calditrichaceae bacterium]
SETSDVNMKATYYCNWFDGTYSRHPRTRYGKVHLLNNLYTGIIGYGVGVTCVAQVMLEGNYFENTAIPTLISQVNDPEETLSGDPEGYLKAASNLTINSGEIVENLSEYEFDPHTYYDYSVIDSNEVKGIVQSMAGAGKLDFGTTVKNEESMFPTNIVLNQNYPNPFNPVTKIEFSLEQYTHVNLEVFDITGKKVKTLLNTEKGAGIHAVVFNGSSLVSGIYFYRLQCAGHDFYRRMMLIK